MTTQEILKRAKAAAPALAIATAEAKNRALERMAGALLRRTEAILRNFEEKTGCVARDAACRETLRELQSIAARVGALPGGAELAEEILRAADRIKE